MKKKGVSPLIATVLLIAFAVALGAVVMNWGKSFTTGKMEDVQQKSDRDISCTMDVSLGITKIDNAPQICYGGSGDNGYLYFLIENVGTRNVRQIDLHIIGNTGVYSNTTMNNTAVPVGGMLRQNITYAYSTYGGVQKVRIVPQVDIAGKVITCSGNALEIDDTDLMNCTSS
jgi:flagellin-like protein